VVICPNADKPGIRANAAIQIKEFQERRGRKTAKSSKRKNVNTLTWDDIPRERRAVLLQQHHSGLVVTTDGGSVASSIIGVTTPQRPSACNSVTLHQDVIVLTGTSSSSLPPIPVAIHSPMAHITLETGTANEEKDCPNLRCVFDTGAALSTANFHFMEAIVRIFPHILKRIYMPAEYADIVLSGIVTSSNDEPITMELPVGFEIHLPYLTKDGSETSLLVAAGPDVAVNLILGLPFIKATGMIGDFVDNVCQAKHLLISCASRSPSTSSAHRSLSLSSRPLLLPATLATFRMLPMSLLLFGNCFHPPLILCRRASRSPVRKHDSLSRIAGFRLSRVI
jgi:hypothetical protein